MFYVTRSMYTSITTSGRLFVGINAVGRKPDNVELPVGGVMAAAAIDVT